MTITLEDVYRALGENVAKISAILDNLEKVEATLECVRVEQVELGLGLGRLTERCLIRGQTCMQRMQHQSDEVAKVRDNSQVIRVQQVKQETVVLTVLKVIGAGAVLTALGGGLYKLFSWLGG